MDSRSSEVKGSAAGSNAKRPYDGTARRERAAANQRSILDHARRRFLADGYAATTIAAVAADAGVSDHTIYKTFGGKPGLVRAIRLQALEGAGPTPAEARSDALHEQGLDARTILESWGALTAEVSPRVVPILLLVRDAAVADPEIRELRDELDDDRLRRMKDNARRLRDAGHLRRGITMQAAADVLWTYSSPELYEVLVLRRGWPARRFGGFVGDALIAALL